MYRQMKQEEPEKEILTALAMIDREKRGLISAAELRAKLTRLGEKLSEEEGMAASDLPLLLFPVPLSHACTQSAPTASLACCS